MDHMAHFIVYIWLSEAAGDTRTPFLFSFLLYHYFSFSMTTCQILGTAFYTEVYIYGICQMPLTRASYKSDGPSSVMVWKDLNEFYERYLNSTVIVTVIGIELVDVEKIYKQHSLLGKLIWVMGCKTKLLSVSIGLVLKIFVFTYLGLNIKPAWSTPLFSIIYFLCYLLISFYAYSTTLPHKTSFYPVPELPE